MNIFEQASRQKLRIATLAGVIAVEDLWDLPLTSTMKNRLNLDDLARQFHKQVQESATLSFVTPASGVDVSVQLTFDIVKYIIDVKVAERDEAKVKADRSAQKQALLEVLAQKETEELRGKSADEIKAMIAAL